MFQNDPGPPKYALELRDYVKYMFFLHFTLHYSQELKVRGPDPFEVKDYENGPFFCPFPLGNHRIA